MKKLVILMIFIIGIITSINVYRYFTKKSYNQDNALTYKDDFYYNLLLTEPLQEDLKNSDLKSYNQDNFTITTIKKYKVTARILSRENYYYSEESDILPIDLVLGWNLMSDLDIVKNIKISQSNRFYFWRIKNFEKISRKNIEINSVNTHIGGINKEITNQLKNVKKGDLVFLEGYLVNIKNNKNNSQLISSLTRNDTGAGACEVLIVTAIKVLD